MAAANSADPAHASCVALLGSDARAIVPAPVIAEAGYLIGKAGGAPAEAEFLRSLSSSRYTVVAPTDLDLRRAADLVEQYGDLGLGSTDALVMAIAESAGDRMVATLDHRHFGIVRSKVFGRFDLLPKR